MLGLSGESGAGVHRVERRVWVPFYYKEQFISSLGVLESEPLPPRHTHTLNSMQQHDLQSVAHLKSE